MAASLYDVRGRTVLVTGAARGMGAEAARQLSARGARLALAGLEPELLEQVAASLPGEAARFEADVTSWEDLEAAVAGTVERFGGIDVVIANAGVAPVGTVETLPREAFERTLEVNLLGVWRTVRVALPHVLARRGYVLPIASLAAAAHAPLMAHYAASKAGVEAFADSLRVEVAHTGTRVGVGYFSFIDTEMVASAFSDPAAAEQQRRARGPLTTIHPLRGRGEGDRRRRRAPRALGGPSGLGQGRARAARGPAAARRDRHAPPGRRRHRADLERAGAQRRACHGTRRMRRLESSGLTGCSRRGRRSPTRSASRREPPCEPSPPGA